MSDITWVVPPVYLVNRAIAYGKLCKAQMILVVLLWHSAVIWPTIAQLIEDKLPYLRNKLVQGNIFHRGKKNTSIFDSQDWKGSSLALHLDFTRLYIEFLPFITYYDCFITIYIHTFFLLRDVSLYTPT